MDYIKPFAKNEKVPKILIQAVRKWNQYTGVEFSMEKYALLIMKSGKQQMTARIEIPNQKKKKSEHSEKRKHTSTWAY